MDQASTTSKPLSSSLTSLAKSLAKRVPSKVLVPTLLDIWQQLAQSKQMVSLIETFCHFNSHINSHQAKISAYFDVLGRALQHADRPIVLEHLRPAFKIFLEALDVVKADHDVKSILIHNIMQANEISRLNCVLSQHSRNL